MSANPLAVSRLWEACQGLFIAAAILAQAESINDHPLQADITNTGDGAQGAFLHQQSFMCVSCTLDTITLSLWQFRVTCFLQCLAVRVRACCWDSWQLILCCLADALNREYMQLHTVAHVDELAICNDRSPGAYYHRPGTADNSTRHATGRAHLSAQLVTQ